MHAQQDILITKKAPEKNPLSYARLLHTQRNETYRADDFACYSDVLPTGYTCSIMVKLCHVKNPT
jgi:hypothetical protein